MIPPQRRSSKLREDAAQVLGASSDRDHATFQPHLKQVAIAWEAVLSSERTSNASGWSQLRDADNASS